MSNYWVLSRIVLELHYSCLQRTIWRNVLESYIKMVETNIYYLNVCLLVNKWGRRRWIGANVLPMITYSARVASKEEQELSKDVYFIYVYICIKIVLDICTELFTKICVLSIFSKTNFPKTCILCKHLNVIWIGWLNLKKNYFVLYRIITKNSFTFVNCLKLKAIYKGHVNIKLPP